MCDRSTFLQTISNFDHKDQYVTCLNILGALIIFIVNPRLSWIDSENYDVWKYFPNIPVSDVLCYSLIIYRISQLQTPQSYIWF